MSGEETSGEEIATGEFPVTRWTRVLAARGDSTEAKGALSDLCRSYYGPVKEFLRHTVRDVDAATVEDLTQEFFERLLEKSRIAGVERGRGKFRSYLLGAVKHFVSDWRDREGAEKRGGGKEIVSLDAAGETATERGTRRSASAEIADEGAEVPDAYLDRQWAMTVLERALAAVAKEYEDAGKSAQFEALKGWLSGDAVDLSQADAAAELGISEGAVKVAIHRLRKSFRGVLRREVAETLEDENDAGEELRYLVEVLSG